MVPVCSLQLAPPSTVPLALWLASPLLFQMRLEFLALGFLKTVTGFERKWFGVFKSSCVPSSQLDSQISLSRDYRCHVNVFISDVFSQCPRGLNLLLKHPLISILLPPKYYWHLLEGEKTLDRYSLMLNCFSDLDCDICQRQSTVKQLLKVACLFLLTLLIWDMGGHTVDVFRG